MVTIGSQVSDNAGEITVQTGPLQKVSPWTPERVEILKRMWCVEERSAGVIANVLGNVSRNAVIGKIYRLGLPARAKDIRQAVMKTKAYNRPKGPPKPRHRARSVSLPPTPLPLPEVDEDRPGVLIMALTHDTCRAVIRTSEQADDRQAHFCGEPVKENQKFCAGHYARYYQPPKLRSA